jgi:flagellar hook-associated protein 2
MGTVGINFGNLATGNGFDVASTVASIQAISGGVETPWKAQIASLQAQDTAFSTIGTALSTFSTALGSLTNFDGVFASKLGSSSDTNVLTLSSASAAAVAGSHTVTVTSLAATSSNYSDRVTNVSDTLSGSLEIKVGSNDQTVTIDSSNNTLKTLAAAINAGSYGVTASVVQDTQGYRLSLVSQTSGTAGQITLTPSLTDTSNTNTAVHFSVGQSGADAVLNVDGLDTTSASNTVTGAIPGVTFQLLAAAPSTPVQIQVTNDNGSIETAFSSLVTAYNAVVSDIKTQEGKDSTGKAEPLFGNTTLAAIQTQIAQAMLGGAAVGGIANIAQLGLSLGQDGKLTLQTSTLDAALNSNFSDIMGFIQNQGSFGQGLTTTLDQLGSVSTKGAIYLALQQNTAQEASLNLDVSNEDTLLATQKTALTKELNAANQILQGIPDQLNEINQIYSAETGYNQATN